MANRVKCSSCGQQKHELKQRKSKLMPGAVMYLCGECIEKKREPRGFVVLAGRERGQDAIAYWIKPQRYIGEPITVRELT